MSPVRRSLLLSFIGRYASMALRLGSMVALARLLTPEEFEAFAAAAAAIAVVATLTDAGIHQYLIRAEVLTAELRRTAFGLALCLGAAAFSLVAALCWLAPEVWLSPDLRWSALLLGLILLSQPFSTVAIASLQRDMRFAPLACTGLVGAAVLAAGSVALAAFGFGPIGLALASMAEAFTATGLLLLWQAPLRPSCRGWRPMLGFGWAWIAIGGLRQAGDGLARLTIGAAFGLGAIGTLSRAQGILQVFDRALLDAVSPVVLPALAAAQRAARPLAAAYLRQVTCLAAVAWPFFAGVALLADPIVLLLLGPQWEGAVPLVRTLALSGAALPLSALTLPYLVALGAARAFVPVQGSLQAGKLAAVLLACAHSLELACAALALENIAKAWFSQNLLARYMGLRPGPVLGALARAAIPALGAAAGMALAAEALPTPSTAAAAGAVLAAAASAGVSSWALLIFVTNHPLSEEAARILLAAKGRLRHRGAEAGRNATAMVD